MQQSNTNQTQKKKTMMNAWSSSHKEPSSSSSIIASSSSSSEENEVRPSSSSSSCSYCSSSCSSIHHQDTVQEPTANFPLNEQIAFHETMLESLQKRMMVLQEEIQSERERLKCHQERIVELEQREGYLKRARDENVVLLKGVTQTLDKCIQRFKRGMKMKRNEEKEEEKEGEERRGEDESVADDGDETQPLLNHPSSGENETGMIASDSVAVKQSDYHTIGSSPDKKEKGYYSSSKETAEATVLHPSASGSVDDNPPLLPPPPPPATPLTPLPTTDPCSNQQSSSKLLRIPTIRVHSSSIFHQEYMKKRWGQTYPNDNAIFHLSPSEEGCPMLPLHRPCASVRLLEKMMMISHREVVARREKVVEKYMSSKSSSSCLETRDTFCIQQDYDDTIKGTILDIYAGSHYDPHLFQSLKKMERMDDLGEGTIQKKNKRSVGPCLVKDAPTIQTNTANPSTTQSMRRVEIHPNKIICRKALFGKCNDAFCPYQHLSGRSNLKTKSNKLRTVETYQYTPEVMLPVDSCPFPPPPMNRIVQKGGKVPKEQKDYMVEDDVEGDNHHDSNYDDLEVMEPRKKRRVGIVLFHDEEEGKTCRPPQEEEEEVKNDQTSGSSEKDVSSSIGPCGDDYDSNMSLNSSDSEMQGPNKERREYHGETTSCHSVCEEENDSHMSLNSSDLENQESNEQICGRGEDNVSRGANQDDDDSDMSLNSSDCHSSDYEEENDSNVSSRRIYLAADEDYIELPRLDDDVGEAQVSSAIQNILSESDNNVEEANLRLQNLEKDVATVAANDKHQDLSSLYEALVLLGFKVTSEAIDGETSYVITYKYPLAFLPRVAFQDLFRQTLLLDSIVSGVQLCIHAGRVDLSQGILDFGSDDNFSQDCPIPAILKESHFFIINLVMDTLARLSEGSTCGRGTQSPNSIYHIQQFLATLSHFTRNYLEVLTSQNVDSMDELEVYVTDVANNLQITVQSLFHDTAPAISGSENFVVLVTELEASLNAMSNLTEAETCRKLSDFVVVGQRVASVAADMVLQLGDPQLVVENILFALVACLKMCSNGRLVGIPSCEDKSIFRNTNWSSKSAKQVAIFNLFGPGIFTSISGVVYLMSKESSRSFTACSRHEGILVQLKQLLMQSIQFLDFSGVISNNIESQFLLCPFFGMLTNVLVVCHSYTLTHVLLVNALYTAHTAKNWAVYSDLLWSQLLQLHASFPPAKIEDNNYMSDLVKRPSEYGIYPSKFTLNGDNALVNLMRLETSIESSLNENYIEQVDHITSLCMRLSFSKGEAESFVENNDTAVTVKLEGATMPSHLAPYLGEFPMSFCLLGSKLRSLHLQNCGLVCVPFTFGDWFPQLEVSNLEMSPAVSV